MASFTFGAGNARKVLRLPLYALGALTTLVAPRTNRLWVFGSGTGPGEGALPLYLLARENLNAAHPDSDSRGADTRLVWLASTDAELTRARALGLDAEKKSGIRGFWLTLRARVIVVTHGFGDVNRFATRDGFVVQLWHGIPLKKLHLDSPAALRLSFLPNHRLVRTLMSRAYRLAGRGISLFPVASQLVAARIASAFGVAPDRIVVTGDPRDDVLLAGTPDSRRTTARTLLPADIPSDSRVVLYAPTWRDGAPDPGAPSSDEWRAIAEWLERTNSVLLVRTHPLGSGDYADGPEISARIRLLPPAVLSEVTPALPAIDALVTDYSSIAFDYALVGGPIVFLAPDVESYVGSRGLYEPYRQVSGGKHVATWENALRVLDDRWQTPVEAPPMGAPHERWLRDENFDYLDGRATERVFAEILARTGIVGITPELGAATARPLVTALAFDDAAVHVTVDTSVDSAELEGARGRVTALRTESVLTFPLLTTRWGVDGLALPSGDYRLTLEPAGDGRVPTTRVTVTAPLPARLIHP
ncbi:MAG TPA: CDP-glycerol glycerophosphotransferase family protein, partial [Pseudolysinimonas sp.]|nr:CDP-glycerol glycerophosphotransferase family protein [Pseudolysinimonas sp.]